MVSMEAMSVVPGQPDSARVEAVPEPPAEDGAILVEGLLVGICGTDIEITRGYGTPPPGEQRLVIGHESLGRVIEAPGGEPVAPGDLVVGVVRRPDPVPCPNCAADQWDFCSNGQYTERGIKGRHGYGSQHWRADPRFAIKVPAGLGELAVLTEPTSVVAKAWEQVERVSVRAPVTGRTVLITGAGPIGLLAALLGVQRGYQVHVLDRVSSGPKPGLVADLGAVYHDGAVSDLGFRPDLVIECTGFGQLVFDLAGRVAPAGIICLAGLSSGHHSVRSDMDQINAELVLENAVFFGTVNAARRNYEQAVAALATADRGWLGKLITRKVPLGSWPAALDKQPGDVKVVVDLTA
jgi:threonine dehydrogenase-like Zn-dependent dehydrogenase